MKGFKINFFSKASIFYKKKHFCQKEIWIFRRKKYIKITIFKKIIKIKMQELKLEDILSQTSDLNVVKKV
ncbi:hypothetical protein LDC_1604 [sediment metagenome]|uniref:Uncharacterized protein n=1 Tax=sediment metagenome TaxID=749907 RepID=D9PJ95_9ZZZZ